MARKEGGTSCTHPVHKLYTMCMYKFGIWGVKCEDWIAMALAMHIAYGMAG